MPDRVNEEARRLARSRQQEYVFATPKAKNRRCLTWPLCAPSAETMTHSRLPILKRPTRRQVLKSAALGSAPAIATPYVHVVYLAGSLSRGVRNRWVHGAN